MPTSWRVLRTFGSSYFSFISRLPTLCFVRTLAPRVFGLNALVGSKVALLTYYVPRDLEKRELKFLERLTIWLPPIVLFIVARVPGLEDLVVIEFNFSSIIYAIGFSIICYNLDGIFTDCLRACIADSVGEQIPTFDSKNCRCFIKCP
jgi:hypothetical protein